MDLPLNRHTALSLLYSEWYNPFDEENFHSWRPIESNPDNIFKDYGAQKTFTHPFLRRWDYCSGSHPNKENRMQARAPRQRLHTGAIRSEVLTWHAKHRNWENVTPFISFASSLARLTEFMNSRNWKGDSTLTVVNPNVRIARELPMINMGREMRHYGVPDPYGRGYAYYDAQYLLLWEVTPEEIAGHWDWDELSQNPNWYEEEVVPAFRAHDQRFLEGTSIQDAFDLSAMQGALPGPGAHGDDDDDDDGHKADRGASPSETSHSGDSVCL